MRSSRATRSADGSGSTEGAQVSTSARPRSTSGTVVLRARPLLPLAASARPSQPVDELVRPRAAAFEHLLGVEVRALAVGQADGVDDRRLAAADHRHAARRGSDAARRSRRSRSGGAAYWPSGPRAAAKSASPTAGAAPRPSRPPRRITSTRRLPPGPAAPARVSVGQAARLPVTAAAVVKRRRRAGLCKRAVEAVAIVRVHGVAPRVAQRRWNSGASSSRASACEPSAARSICARGLGAEPRAEARGGQARGRRRCGRRGRRGGSPIRPASRPRRARASPRRDRSSRPATAPPSPAGRARTRRRRR